MPNGSCPLCAWAADLEGRGDGSVVTCPLCGTYRITGTAMAILRKPGLMDSNYPDLTPYLSAHTKQATMAGSTAILTETNWREIADAHRSTPVPVKARKLLEHIGRGSTYPGGRVVFDVKKDFPIIDARNETEASYFLRHLISTGVIRVPEDARFELGVFEVTPGGWQELFPTGSGGVPGTCFIAMSFDSALDSAFDDGIRPAIEDDCGYVVNRVDRVPHNDNITNRILAGIRASQFVVADFTGQRQSVYYEAGFAEALGRTVVRTCRDTEIRDLHFDTRQFFHLEWSTPTDLRVLLADHVAATIGVRRRE